MYELLLIFTLTLNIASDIIDRNVSRPTNVHALSLWTSITQLLLICPFIGLVDLPALMPLLLLFSVGGFSSFARGRWYLALSNRDEKLSRFTPFVRLSSVMVIFCAIVFMDETMTPMMFFGAALMITAAFLTSLERTKPAISDFLHANKALGMVLIFATSNALITITYKYLLNHSVSIITIYFFLKLFQCLPLLFIASNNATLAHSYREITHIRLFVGSRVLQTIAALTFLLALRNLNLSTVEPIVALSPFIYFLWEWCERRFRLFGYQPAEGKRVLAKRQRIFRILAITLSIIGFIFLTATDAGAAILER